MRFLLFFIGLMLCVARIQAQGTGCASAAALTINGSCASATISDGTADAPALSSCATGTFRTEGWYKFTVTAGPQNVTVTGTASTRNLFLQVISETSPCAGLTQIGCANTNNTNGSQTESVTLPGLANGTYYIKVVNVGTAGTMALSSLCVTAPLPPPANDLCSGAIAVSCGNSYAGNTTSATRSANDPGMFCGTLWIGAASPGVWYSFTGTGQVVTASVCGSASWDTRIGVYTGSCGAYNCVNGDDNSCSLQSTVTFSSTLGTTYFIHVDGNFGSSGAFTMDVSCPLTPLPVELLSFTAVCDGGKVELDWSVATETNNKQYEIERSEDGILYTTIATIAEQGTNIQQHRHHYSDDPEEGKQYYYRLKQVDLDNTVTYYKTLVSVNALCDDSGADVSLFPNPANESVTVKTNYKSPVSVEIMNDCGQLVYSGTIAGDSEERISTTHFASGIYMVRFVTNRNVFIRKLVIKH